MKKYFYRSQTQPGDEAEKRKIEGGRDRVEMIQPSREGGELNVLMSLHTLPFRLQKKSQRRSGERTVKSMTVTL